MGVPPIPHYIQSLPTHSPVSRRVGWMSLSLLSTIVVYNRVCVVDCYRLRELTGQLSVIVSFLFLSLAISPLPLLVLSLNIDYARNA